MTGHTAHLSLGRRVGPRGQRRSNRGMASGGKVGAMVKAQFGRDANILTQTQLHPALDTDGLARCLGGDFNRQHQFIVIPDGAHSRGQEHLGRGPCDAQIGDVARPLPVKLRWNPRIARRALELGEARDTLRAVEADRARLMASVEALQAEVARLSSRDC